MNKNKAIKQVIKEFVWEELETLKIGRSKYIEFEYGKKRFIIKRTK